MLRVWGHEAWVSPAAMHIWLHTTAQWIFCPFLARENYFPFLPCLLILVAAPRVSSHHDHTPWYFTSPPCWPAPGSEQESVTLRTSGAGKGTRMPPRECVDTVGPRHIVLKTWAHAHRCLMGTLQTKTAIDRTSIFFLLMCNSLWESAEIIS